MNGSGWKCQSKRTDSIERQQIMFVPYPPRLVHLDKLFYLGTLRSKDMKNKWVYQLCLDVESYFGSKVGKGKCEGGSGICQSLVHSFSKLSHKRVSTKRVCYGQTQLRDSSDPTESEPRIKGSGGAVTDKIQSSQSSQLGYCLFYRPEQQEGGLFSALLAVGEKSGAFGS